PGDVVRGEDLRLLLSDVLQALYRDGRIRRPEDPPCPESGRPVVDPGSFDSEECADDDDTRDDDRSHEEVDGYPNRANHLDSPSKCRNAPSVSGSTVPSSRRSQTPWP